MDGNLVVVGGIGASLEGFEKMVPDLVKYNPTLMLLTGNSVVDGTDQSYRKTYEALSSLNKRYGVAVEVTPGPQERYGDKLPDTYKGYFGDPTASFVWNGIKFITLDSSSGKLEAKQLEFLDKHLTTKAFIFTHSAPNVGLWKNGLAEGNDRFLSVLAERSHLVMGCFFGNLKTLHQERLESQGMILNIPAYVVGNGSESYALGQFGYSRPGKKGGLAVMVRNGQATFEAIEASDE